jgi:hypothetical protein
VCLGVNSLLACEAFVGVLFGSVTGAIIFGKIARIQTIAQISYSDPICVRYGSGLKVNKAHSEDEDDEYGNELPCPVLEFRILNDRAHLKGGEIIDATVNVVATTPAKTRNQDAGATFRSSFVSPEGKKPPQRRNGIMCTKTKNTTSPPASPVKRRKRQLSKLNLLRGNKKADAGSIIQQLNHQLSRPAKTMMMDIGDNDEVEPYNEKELEAALEKMFEAKFVEKLERQREKLAHPSGVVRGENSKICPARMFHKLEIETDSHPFFKRAWLIRHVLNSSSPLLSDEARAMVERNNGFWPQELNSYASVRKHVFFNQLIVNFSGTSHGSGSSVFGHKVYDFGVVNIGYTFAPMMHKDRTTKLIKVNAELLNDVREQYGGGAEPFDEADFVSEDNNPLTQPLEE